MGLGCDSVRCQQSFLTLAWTQPQCLVVHNCCLSNLHHSCNMCSLFVSLLPPVHNMSSRRLDISSLLCDDNPPNFSPLDVLVQAATEERRRLTVTESSPRFLPLTGTLSPHYEEEDQRIHRQRQQQQQQHHDHILLQPLHQHQHQQDIDQRHALDMDRRRRLQDAELQKRMEDQQRAQEFAVQRDRAFQLERRHDLYDRQREDHFRIQEAERQQDSDQRAAAYQREVERARDLERQSLQRELERQREIGKRELEVHREVERLRDIDRQREMERQMDIERQREQREPERKELERQRDLELIQRRQQFHDTPLRFHDPRIPSPIITSPHPPSISHLISHPPPRKSDPGQIKLLNTPIHADSFFQQSTRQVKKRRYSDSPTRPIINDKERMVRERERMAVGELGYGRIDSPIVGPSTAPRRPGSGHGQGRKSMPVAELLLDKPISITQPDLRDRLVNPLGRRSPPGSQIGRAKAARKSDEYIHKEIYLPPPPPPLTIELDVKKHKEEPKTREMPKVKEEIRPKEEVKLKEEPKSREGTKPREAKEDTKPTRHRVHQEDNQHKKMVTPALIPAPPPPPPAKIHPPSKKSQDDAHEWFLQQYEEDPSPTTSSRPEPPHSPSPSLSPAMFTLPVYGPRSPSSSHKVLTPITAAVALEQELEELVSEPPPPPPTSLTTINKKQDPDDTHMDLDVDLAVTELVAGTLDGEDVKHEHAHLGMEVDVEDELLSLIDDCPAANNNINMTRRTSTSSSSLVTTASGSGTGAKQALPLRSGGDAPHTSPTVSVSSTLVSPAVQHPSTRPTSERRSMPPPPTTNTGVVSRKSNEREGVVPAKKKKKEPASKGTKAKAATAAPAKPRAKPAAKGKKIAAAAAAVETAAVSPLPSISKTTKATTKKSAPSTSRSRSTSAMPGGSAAPEGADTINPEKQEEEEDSDVANDDDKLYCVCKTKYDEDRFMIACDKCDEWYHTQCVNMPELEVDLVDQFLCPPCVEKNPELNLRTTYKQRCLYGIRHPDPSSSKACHKAARGAFSKYCSDTCGLNYMQSRIDTWAKKGGKPDKLWESVKNAEKREGVVVCAMENEVNGHVNGDGDGVKMEVDSSSNGDVVKHSNPPRIVPPPRTKVERETERLNALLESVMNLREEIKRGMEVVVWRERLLQLASERADHVGLCGWDQRLCFDDEEWADIGDGVLESYEGLKEGGGGEMDVDAGDEQWWCPGQKLCDRHAGWQTVRYKDVCKEREKKEEALAKLTTREREIRKRIEDMLDPQNRVSSETTSRGSVKNPDVELARQFLKRKYKGSERGKKRRAPTS